jgi:hypothetical protein
MSQKHDPDVTENSISLRLPEFSASNPRVWFVQLELYFRNKRISSENTKFEHLSMLLPDRIATEVVDIMEAPPEENAYTIMKEAVLSRTTASGEARLQTLLAGVELGDRTPSQLLRHMRSLAGSHQVTDTLLRSLWSKCLPANTRLVLSTYEADTPLEKLAQTADKVHECFFPVVHEVTAPFPAAPDPPHEPDLRQQLAALTLRVEELSIRRSSPHSPSQPASRSNSRRRNTEHNNGVCYYHRRFGDKARKCTLPCTHPKSFASHPHSGNLLASQ